MIITSGECVKINASPNKKRHLFTLSKINTLLGQSDTATVGDRSPPYSQLTCDVTLLGIIRRLITIAVLCVLIVYVTAEWNRSDHCQSRN